MLKRLVGLVIVLSFVCGCETAPKRVARIPFPQTEYDALPKTGTGIVRGQGFMRTMGGDVKTAAGYKVWLNPVTSYSQQWYEEQYKKTDGSVTVMALEDADPRQQQYIRDTTADAEGRFEFKNVPPGDYFLTTNVIWHAPTSGGNLRKQGGVIAKQITVKDGEEQTIILTR